MRALVVAAFLSLLVTGCSGLRADYRGGDAGALVYSAENMGDRGYFSFWYKLVGQPGDRTMFGGDGEIENNPGSILTRREDFNGYETGWVNVRYLKPGDYEVYQYSLIDIVGSDIQMVYVNETYVPVFVPLTTETAAPQDFSLRFRIEPGKTTYIGCFATLSAGGSNSLLTIVDRRGRDLAIARKMHPKLPASEIIAVPDLSQANIARLQAGP